MFSLVPRHRKGSSMPKIFRNLFAGALLAGGISLCLGTLGCSSDVNSSGKIEAGGAGGGSAGASGAGGGAAGAGGGATGAGGGAAGKSGSAGAGGGSAGKSGSAGAGGKAGAGG